MYRRHFSKNRKSRRYYPVKITIKKFTVNKALSEETLCFSATVFVDGKMAFSVLNRGNGGCHEYSTYGIENGRKLLDSAMSYARNLKKDDFEALDCLLLEMIEDRKLIAECAKKTIYRLPGTENSTFVINAKFSKDVKSEILYLHPTAILLNETLAGQTAQEMHRFLIDESSFRRYCKSESVCMDQNNKVYRYKVAFSQKVKAEIEAKHPESTFVFANEYYGLDKEKQRSL